MRARAHEFSPCFSLSLSLSDAAAAAALTNYLLVYLSFSLNFAALHTKNAGVYNSLFRSARGSTESYSDLGGRNIQRGVEASEAQVYKPDLEFQEPESHHQPRTAHLVLSSSLQPRIFAKHVHLCCLRLPLYHTLHSSRIGSSSIQLTGRVDNFQFNTDNYPKSQIMMFARAVTPMERGLP